MKRFASAAAFGVALVLALAPGAARAACTTTIGVVMELTGPAGEYGQRAREPLETHLPERDRSLQAAFDRAAVGIAVVSLQGRWLRFNQRLCDLLGYDCDRRATDAKENACGKSFLDQVSDLRVVGWAGEPCCCKAT